MIKRGNRKFISDYNVLDMYKYCKKEHGLKLTKKEFIEHLNEITEYIVNRILFEADEYKLPHKLGHLRIKRRKQVLRLDAEGKLLVNKMMIDFNSCWKLWREQYPGKTDEEIAKIPNKKKVYFLNDHSHGYYNKFYWDKRSCVVQFNSIYKLEINRNWKQMLTKLSKQNMIYYE